MEHSSMPESTQTKSRLFGLLLGVLLLPMIPVLDHAGKPELIYPALVASIAIGFAIRGYWELRGHLWFWCAIITIATIHALLILSMNWRTGWVPGSALMLFAIVDFALILGIIGLLKRLVGSSESRGS